MSKMKELFSQYTYDIKKTGFLVNTYSVYFEGDEIGELTGAKDFVDHMVNLLNAAFANGYMKRNINYD